MYTCCSLSLELYIALVTHDVLVFVESVLHTTGASPPLFGLISDRIAGMKDNSTGGPRGSKGQPGWIQASPSFYRRAVLLHSIHLAK